MPTATFDARAVYPPEEGKRKSFKVLGSDGGTYFLKPPEGAGVQKGSTYEVFYEENDFKGQKLRMVQTIKPSSVTAGAAQAVLGQAQAQAAHNGAGPAPAYRPDSQAENIFVAGAVNHAIAAKDLVISAMRPGELAEIIGYLRKEYRDGGTGNLSGGAVKVVGQQHDPEMADEIPF